MALTVEDGSIVENANTYETAEATQAFATARGLTLPTGTGATAAIEILLIVAMDYLEALRAEYQGSKVSKAQTTQFPRKGVVVDGYAIDEDEIPECLKQAQMRLACYAHANGGTLSSVSDGRIVVGEKVEGAIDMKYADHGDSNPQPQFPEADKLIAPLLWSASFGGAGIAIRV